MNQYDCPKANTACKPRIMISPTATPSIDDHHDGGAWLGGRLSASISRPVTRGKARASVLPTARQMTARTNRPR